MLPIVQDVGNSILGISSANRQMNFQAEQAELNRDWQSNENKLARDWQEKMWNAQNLYNSPSAMMQRYRDAGLNPFLLGGNTPTVGSSSPASPSPAGSFTPPSSGASANIPRLRAFETAIQAKGVDANAANQRAQSIRTLVQAAGDAYEKGGRSAYMSVIHTFAPFLINSDPNNSPYERLITSEVRRNVAESVMQENQASLVHAFGEKQALQGLEESNYRISEIVSRLNTLRITNDIAVKKLANDTIIAAAQAFNLKKVGEYYQASKEQLEALKDYVVEAAKAEAELSSNQAELSTFSLPFNKGLVGARAEAEQNELDIKGNKAAIFVKYLTDAVGDIVHVGFGSVSKSAPIGFMQAEWNQPNPFGGSTRYKKVQYNR